MEPDTERPSASRPEKVLLAAVMAFYAGALALHALSNPGWAAYDEESYLDQLQGWREGHHLLAGYGFGTLYRALGAGLCLLGGPHIALLHTMGAAAVEAEALLLYAWLRGPLGSRAALWAALADLGGTATFARGACLLSVCLLPTLFLAAVASADRIRGRAPALLWGLACALLLLDYEGWVGALLFLLPYAAWSWRGRVGLRSAAAAGFLAGCVLVWRLSPNLTAHVLERRETSLPGTGLVVTAWTNLERLVLGGPRLPFSGVPGWPWPQPWIWPLALVGAAPALRRVPWLAWLLVCGSLPLAMQGSFQEPHRFCLALLPLAACAGAGAGLVWRRRAGAVLCLALFALGAAAEIRAWHRSPAAQLDADYGLSRNLERAGAWLARNAPPEGWRVITGLDWHDDGAFRFLLAGEGLKPGRDPVALVYWDILPGLRTLAPGFKVLYFGGGHPLALVLLPPEDATHLERVQAEVSPLHWRATTRATPDQARILLAWLKAPGHGDVWARTVAWELWLHASLLDRSLDLASVRALLGEPLVSGWAPDTLAVTLAGLRPSLARRFWLKAEAVDPRRRGLPFKERESGF